MFTVPHQSFTGGRPNANRRLALREEEEELRAKQREADFAAMAYSQSLAEQKAAGQAEAIEKQVKEIQLAAIEAEVQDRKEQTTLSVTRDEMADAIAQADASADAREAAAQEDRDFRVSRLLALHQEQTEAQKLEAQKKALLAAERPGLLRLLDAPLTQFSHLVDAEFREIRRARELYSERRLADEANAELDIAAVDIALSSQRRIRTDLEDNFMAEQRSHDLDALSLKLDNAVAERRVAERHRDEAGKRCTALQVEAVRLKRDCDHKTHEILEIEAKLRLEQREHQQDVKRSVANAYDSRRALQIEYDKACDAHTEEERFLELVIGEGRVTRAEGAMKQNQANEAKQIVEEQLQLKQQQMKDLEYQWQTQHNAHGKLNSALDSAWSNTRLITTQSSIAADNVHDYHSRNLQEGLGNARSLNLGDKGIRGGGRSTELENLDIVYRNSRGVSFGTSSVHRN